MSSTKKICIDITDQRVPTEQPEKIAETASIKPGELTAALAQIVTLTAMLKSAASSRRAIDNQGGNVDNQILVKLAKLQDTVDIMIQRLPAQRPDSNLFFTSIITTSF